MRAAYPLLSLETNVFVLFIDVPWTANHVAKPIAYKVLFRRKFSKKLKKQFYW